MDLTVAGKIAFVTGSTSGIGLGIAERLAETGCDVIITGICEQHLVDGILGKLRSTYKGKFMYVGGDLTNEDSITKMCKEISEVYPDGIDILINNAGIQHVCPVEDYPVPKWHEMVAIQLTAPFLLVKYFLPNMKKKGWGRIVNTSSQMGLISAPGKVPYSATKAGLIGLTKGVALEAAEFGVTCNAICPGFVETFIVKTQLEAIAAEQSISVGEAREKFFSERHPNKKPISIEQVSSYVNYICSEDAASINGAALSIDTGYTAK